MVPEYEMRRADQQLAALREQAQARSIFDNIFNKSKMLLEDKADYQKGTIYSLIKTTLSQIVYEEGDTLPHEARHAWKLTKQVDLDGKMPDEVTVTGFGSKNPNKLSKIRIDVANLNQCLDINSDGETVVVVDKVVRKNGGVYPGKRETANSKYPHQVCAR